MRLIGHPFDVMVSSLEELAVKGESPEQHVMRLAEQKAVDIGGTLQQGVVIGSDTIVVLDDDILEKPESPDDAISMLMRLQSRTHTVFTGFALYDTESEKCHIDFDTTQVTMRPFSHATAEKYVATKEPLDKAGSYGIQGFGAVLIDSIKGCYFNVMGLPVPKLMEALHEFTGGEFDYFANNSMTLSE